MTRRAGGASGVPPAQASPSVWTRNPQHGSNNSGPSHVASHQQCMWANASTLTQAAWESDKSKALSVTRSAVCLHATRWQTSFYTLHCSKWRLKMTLSFMICGRKTDKKYGLLVVYTQIYSKSSRQTNKRKTDSKQISLLVSPDRHVIYCNHSQGRRQILPPWHN